MPEENSSEATNRGNHTSKGAKFSERVVAFSGYGLVGAGVLAFMTIAAMNLREQWSGIKLERSATWLDFVQRESATIILLLIGIVTANLGKRLLTTVGLGQARTIPVEDLPLVRQAVIDGKAEPVDQYVRLRSLSGWAGNFTKLGVTGLPLTTVILTLIFSLISLFPTQHSSSFLDLAKLTLGAFIGSFVQRQVERRGQETRESAKASAPERYMPT